MQLFAFFATKIIQAGANSPVLSFVRSQFCGAFSDRCSVATGRATLALASGPVFTYVA
jgi:hypothetical protein